MIVYSVSWDDIEDGGTRRHFEHKQAALGFAKDMRDRALVAVVVRRHDFVLSRSGVVELLDARITRIPYPGGTIEIAIFEGRGTIGKGA